MQCTSVHSDSTAVSLQIKHAGRRDRRDVISKAFTKALLNSVQQNLWTEKAIAALKRKNKKKNLSMTTRQT